MQLRKKSAALLALGIWAAAVVAGFGAMIRYASRPGACYAPSSEAAAALYAQFGHAGRPLLVMAVHPRCPCTEASLGEMGDLLARSRGACDALLLTYQAPGWPVPPATRRIADVTARVVPDLEGATAKTLGAATSGDVLLIDGRGRVRYYGGLTPARGHRGEIAAQDGILEVIAGGSGKVKSAPVFGCSLRDKCEREGTGS